jgi:hypothetical protein
VRIWSLHPKYLDAQGLVALWREGLLAQAVLRGRTRGYMHHPQLCRFREQTSPLGALADYLRAVHREAAARGYRFDGSKISHARGGGRLPVTRGQLQFEWQHLLAKLRTREPQRYAQLAAIEKPAPHPSFRVVRGGVAAWERSASRAKQRGRKGGLRSIVRLARG